MAEARKLRTGIAHALVSALAFAACVATTVLAQPIGIRSPSWDSLSPAEKQFLAPIQSDWEYLDAQRKAKWRGIAQRYPSMTPDQQQRIKQQRGAWAQLTPAERATAREQYKSMRSLPPEKKVEMRQQWERDQNLPPERKKELATRPPPNMAPQTAPQSQPRNTRPIPPPPPQSGPPPGSGPSR